MNTADFDTLFAYSDACRRQLATVLQQYPETFLHTFQTSSNYTSVQKILAHMMAAEERWITLRLQEKTLPVFYEDRAADTIDEIFADYEAIRKQTYLYRTMLTPEKYQSRYEIHLPQWQFRRSMTIADVLFHILNHENYHRGQIIMALQQQGVDPPNFDYVFLGV